MRCKSGFYQLYLAR
ncbi:hypothetical protein D030_1419A, partial [Vibrio parahaemolyticus AQ3810]